MLTQQLTLLRRTLVEDLTREIVIQERPEPLGEDAPNSRLPTPRLARPEQVSDFTKEAIEEGSDAGLR